MQTGSVFAALALLLLGLSPGQSLPQTQVDKALPSVDRFRIVAYLPEYRVLKVDPAVASKVTDLIFFSLAPTPTGDIHTTNLTPAVEERLEEIKQRNPDLRLLLALGGGDRSDDFAPMAIDPSRRRKFIEILVRFCQEHHFDGVDFDWEFPKNRAESKALELLILETKKAFTPQKLYVSIAVAPWDEFDKKVYAAADSLHLMTYFDETQHTALANARRETEDLLRKGADPRKVCMGIPFYGEEVGKKESDSTYGDIVTKYRPTPEADEAGGIAYNGLRTVRQKTRYALEQKLGGVMIWELGQDTAEGELLNAIREEIARKPVVDRND